jgi:hypothetical protein
MHLLLVIKLAKQTFVKFGPIGRPSPLDDLVVGMTIETAQWALKNAASKK